MKDNIKKVYNDWLEDTIQADVPYQLDPAVGEVTEDLNFYTGLDLTWEEWNVYFIDSLDTIEYLEERADARKRFEGRRFGDLTEEEKNQLEISGSYAGEADDIKKWKIDGNEKSIEIIVDFENGLSVAGRKVVTQGDYGEEYFVIDDEAIIYDSEA